MRARDFEDKDDLRRMQELVSSTWSPRSRFHIGDLAWDRHQHVGREAEWPTRLWHDERGSLAAWAWLSLPGSLEFALDPRHPELLDDVVAWSCGRMESDALGVTCMRSDEASRASLSRMGFKERPAARTSLYLHRLLREVQPGVSPAGTRVRHVEVLSTPEDLAARVAAHRAAFHPSRVTEESYRNVASTWPYLASLDVVVENDAGEVLAYCLGWYDEKNKVGEFEPVGCVPSARRTGAASAACHEVLVRLKVLGADRAVVYPPDDETNRGPEMLYRSLGFEDNDRTVKYVGTWRGRPVDG